MTLSLLTPEILIVFLLLTIRIGAIVLSLPLLNSRNIPAQLKVMLILMLSVALYPLVQTQQVVIPQRLGHVGLVVVSEMLIGLTIGFVAQILFAGIQLGGEIIGQQMGLNFATIFDPQNAHQVSLIAHFQDVLAMLLFLSGSAHHWFIIAMAESLQSIPLGALSASGAVLPVILTLLGKACVIAIQLAAPVSIALLLATLVLGVIARLVPQLNVFALSFPATLGLGMVMLALALPALMGGIQLAFGQLGNDLVQVIRVLGAR
ncbi:MAG TPA: flagellar biosynthetic protein FliR [Candidatus Saccharimonadia bacterium]|nr:flagellar biosynthetic protein FliR [Candidatus Saccharimonadia bacterium]